MKIEDKWYDCIVYRSMQDEKVYVRTEENFCEKFVRLKL